MQPAPLEAGQRTVKLGGPWLQHGADMEMNGAAAAVATDRQTRLLLTGQETEDSYIAFNPNSWHTGVQGFESLNSTVKPSRSGFGKDEASIRKWRRQRNSSQQEPEEVRNVGRRPTGDRLAVDIRSSSAGGSSHGSLVSGGK